MKKNVLAITPTQHERDAFLMKAIMLLKEKGMQRGRLRQTPIRVRVSRTTKTLFQTVTLPTGEKVEMRGTFKKIKGGKSIPTTFKVKKYEPV